MLFVAINFMASTSTDEAGRFGAISAASYDDLMEATGLSRALISAGLRRLIELELVAWEGSHQKRRYRIAWPEYKFFKLPCASIVAGGKIKPFQHFHLRSKFELHALKLYLYFASIRPNHSYCSMVSYETIATRIGILERDIPKAIGLLINSGLLMGISKEHQQTTSKNEPNKYYLTGWPSLVQKTGTAGATSAALAPVATAA